MTGQKPDILCHLMAFGATLHMEYKLHLSLPVKSSFPSWTYHFPLGTSALFWVWFYFVICKKYSLTNQMNVCETEIQSKAQTLEDTLISLLV